MPGRRSTRSSTRSTSRTIEHGFSPPSSLQSKSSSPLSPFSLRRCGWYRVVQWATGNVGSRSFRHVIEHPDLDLVGVLVHGQDKVNKDAGELAGVAPTGVMATNSIEDVLALKPDCVIYMPHVCKIPTMSAASWKAGRMWSPPAWSSRTRQPWTPRPPHASKQPARRAAARSTPAAPAPASSPRRCLWSWPRSSGGSITADRRIRRLLVAQFARDAVRYDGLRRSARRGERSTIEAQGNELRALAAIGRHHARHADRALRGDWRAGAGAARMCILPQAWCARARSPRPNQR